LTSFAPAFDLAALFGEADALAFGELDSKDAPRGVKMDGIVADSEDANVGWAMEEEADEDEEDDDVINVDDLIEDDDEEVDDEEDDGVDVDDMEEDEPAPAAVTRSNRASQRTTTNNIVSVAPPLSKKSKSVSFANKPLGPTPTGTSSAVSQRAKLFAPNDVEAPVSLNKDIRKNAKKDKKKARKVERGVEMELEDFVAEAPLSKPSKPVRPMGAADEAYSFEEFFPSNNSGRRVPMEQEDMDED
jgi:nuclear GTP-binding protein